MAVERATDPGTAWMRAMRQGDFSSAWAISDAILVRRATAEPDWRAPRHEQWIWTGAPLVGKRVLVRCYHGLGDTIQFARFWPRLSHLAASVCVWAQPSLIPILRSLDARLEFLPLHEGAADVEYDVDIESMELAHALRIGPADLPGPIPYLHVRPEWAGRGAPLRSADAPHPSPVRVGLLARAGDWDERRSVPVELMATLARTPGIRAFSLQLDSCIPGAEDLSTPDVLELAARLQALDLVITVDTLLAHLAGALGVPTWTLLAADADWRWMAERDDTPWYPSMRLFRQPRAGAWEPVVRQVRSRLRALDLA